MTRREVHTGDMKTRQIPPVDLPVAGVLVRENESLVLPEPNAPMSDAAAYLAELAFNEEVLTIRLERSSEKNPPKFHDFHVNGVSEWVPVGVPHKLKRKFVEVIARAQPYDVQTEVVEEHGMDPMNRVLRNARMKYPFSVIHDPNPRGFDWLTKLMQSV